MWTAVLHARGQVLEAIGIPLAATIVKGLTLHGGHVEEVAPEEPAAGSLLLGKPTDLGNLWVEGCQDVGFESEIKQLLYTSLESKQG